MQDLTALESLDDQALWRVMIETVPLDQQRRLHHLLSRNQAGILTDPEREELAILQQQADLVMLRKARAAVLLRFRGKRVPTLAELSHLTHEPCQSPQRSCINWSTWEIEGWPPWLGLGL